MKSMWSDEEAGRIVERYAQQGVNADIALRVYTTRLLGRDPALVLHGSGNTSVKTTLPDALGRPTHVLCVKGSGWDMADIEPQGLPAVKLNPLQARRFAEATGKRVKTDPVNAAMLARFGVAKCGLPPPFGFKDLRLLLAFRLQDRGLALALGLENLGALFTLGLHLTAHRLHEVGRRHDILDLDAVDLDAPRRHRGIDNAQQAFVDLVAVRQHLVEVHAAHHRADVGHGELGDRLIQIGDLVARLRGIEHLEERKPVDRDGGVVLGDDVLLRDVDHLLHHVHLAADPVEIRDDQIEPVAHHGQKNQQDDEPAIAPASNDRKATALETWTPQSPAIEADIRDQLIGELATPRYGFTPAGLIKVEAKDEVKKRLGSEVGSPDVADALNLTFAVLDWSKPETAMDAYKRAGKRNRENTWTI